MPRSKVQQCLRRKGHNVLVGFGIPQYRILQLAQGAKVSGSTA